MAGGGDGSLWCTKPVTGAQKGKLICDKAEGLQRYFHHSKLHSANKEKTHNEKNMIRSLDPVGAQTPVGFFKFFFIKRLQRSLYAM